MNQSTNEKTNNHIKSTVHNFSSYQLSDDPLTALSYGLDLHITKKLNYNRIHNDFQQFYQNSVKNIYAIPDDNLTRLKTKLRNACEQHRNIHIPYKYITVIDSLSRNQDICIMKQEKGRSAVVMDGSKYTEKCLNILQTAPFTKLRHDPTKSITNNI